MTTTDIRRAPLPLTRAIAEFASRPRDPDSVPDGAAVATTILDTVGVAIAGRDSDSARIVAEWVASTSSPGPVAVWGSSTGASAADAALVNGTAGHALDWDDASPVFPMHPGTVLVPALLAQAASTKVSGPELAHAYNVGSAVFRAVAEALPVNASMRRGWHTTATVGRLATVAALASLTGATARTTAHALGAAASMASGSISNFGTMTKPLHAGLAARDGLIALGLAARGLTANTNQLEDPEGFFAMFGDPTSETLAALPARLEHWERHWQEDWLIKRHPCCYGTHHVADAALQVRGSFAVDEVERIEALIYQPDVRLMTIGRPTTGLEAKFSVEYVIAAALVRGELPLEAFETEALADPVVDALLDKISYAGAPDEPSRFAELVVRLRNGRQIDVRVDITRGDARLPLTAEEARAKFVSACASGGWPSSYAQAAADVILAVPGAEALDELEAVLAGPVRDGA